MKREYIISNINEYDFFYIDITNSKSLYRKKKEKKIKMRKKYGTKLGVKKLNE